MRILIVDDEAPIRRLVRKWIKTRTTFEVGAEAVDGAAALIAMIKTHIDVVLSDVSMAGMNGLDLTREIKARFPTVHVLLQTSDTDPRTQEEARGAGASGFLSKVQIGEHLIEARSVVQAVGPDRKRGTRPRVFDKIWL